MKTFPIRVAFSISTPPAIAGLAIGQKSNKDKGDQKPDNNMHGRDVPQRVPMSRTAARANRTGATSAETPPVRPTA